ncbi:MAG TPA: hypothetical protein GXX21_02925 [Syntrophomonadaceae bacterium]|nr:hypothetical protein [Syntrophomonadaceae bacterium]
MVFDKNILPLILFQYLPETTIFTALSMLLAGYKIRLKQVVIIGIIGALFAAVVKSQQPMPIVSTLIMVFILIILFVIISKLDVISASIAVFLGFVVLGLVEVANYFVVTGVTGITVQQAMEDLTLRLLFPLPEYILLTVLILVCQKYNFTLINLKELKELSKKDYER